MLVFQLLILYKVQISRVLAFYFDLSRSRHSHLSQWFLMRTACPSLRKSFPITSNHPQSPPITPNHPPITSKLADQSPSNHLSRFIHNDARSDFSNRRRSAFNDQSMWESSYFFTWGAAIMMITMVIQTRPAAIMMMVMMITMVAGMVSACCVLRALRGSKSDPSKCLWRVLAFLLGIGGCKGTELSLPFLLSSKAPHVKK